MDKIDSKDLYCYNKFWINAILFNFLLIKEKSNAGSKKYYAAQQFHYWSATLIINQHFRMISEGSCDTEDWSNDAENSALITGINYILKYR